MTVCIAGRCTAENGEPLIVTVSDTKLTTGLYSSDMVTLKVRHITDKWKCMIAGKFAQHARLVARLHDTVKDDMKYAEVMSACTQAFVEENKRLAEESILAKYGLKMEDFVKSRASLGDVLYETIWGDIARVKLDCDFIVCGFDKYDIAHVFIVSNPTNDNPSFITDCDFPGFAAIGSGYYLADSALYAMQHHSALGLVMTIYDLTKAKFIAESASDVGEQTYLYIFGADGEKVAVDPQLEKILRNHWRVNGQPRLATEAIAAIRGAITRNELVAAPEELSSDDPS